MAGCNIPEKCRGELEPSPHKLFLLFLLYQALLYNIKYFNTYLGIDALGKKANGSGFLINV